MKKKKKLLQIKIDEDLEFAIDCFCIEHGEQTKSGFVRQAIRDRLAKVTSPTYVEPKIAIPTRQNRAPRHETLQDQWKRELEEDRRRQQGLSENQLSDEQQRWLRQR
jgi:hypothetical protein